jgi:phosphatidate cytidylyltransferase
MRQRIITTFVAVPLILVALWYGQWLWALFLSVVAALDVWETYRMARAGGRRPDMPIGLVLAPLLVVDALFPTYAVERAALALAVIAAFLAQIARPPEERSADDWTATLASPVYIGSLMGYGVLLQNLPHGAGLAWTLVGVTLVWVNDSAAYFGGRALGKTPLSLSLSPRKTREGFAVGMLCTVLVAAALPWLAGLWPQVLGPIGLMAWWQLALLGLLVSIAAPFGDLAKSFLKRQVGVKDSGTLIPGHGGVLDRTDSLLFAAPFVYYAARMMMYFAGGG